MNKSNLKSKYLCIIPARGGSKRIPHKNIIPLCGKPLISYSIECAKKIKIFEKIIVSTDDNNIAQISLKYGGEVPFLRPENISADDSTPISLITHVLKYFNNDRFDAVVYLQPTSPLRTENQIQDCLKLFEETNADTLTTVKKVEDHPYWTMTIQNGELNPFFTKNHIQLDRKQLPDCYIENGAIYIIKIDTINKGLFYGKKVIPFIMDRKTSLDIDNPDDLLLAEYYLSLKK